MATPKTKKKNNGSTSANVGASTVDIANFDSAELMRSPHSFRDRHLLGRVQKLLVNIQSPQFEGAAGQVGYTAAEHAEGWALYKQASGETRPLDHHFLSTSTLEKKTYAAILSQLDELENLWFPRTRAIILRVVSKDARGAFLASFFRDLEQQPLGPGVVGSMRTFLDRVEALATSDEPQAKDVLKKLAERGLSAEEVARQRALLNKVEVGFFGEQNKTGAQRVAAARREMQDGVEKLRGWFNDWGTTLRQVIDNNNHLVLLGLVAPTRGGVVTDELEGESSEGDGAVIPAVEPAGQSAPAPSPPAVDA